MVEFLGQLHQAQRLPVAFRRAHAIIAPLAFRNILSLLDADHRHRLSVQISGSADHCRIIPVIPVSVQFKEIIKNQFDIIGGSGSVYPPCGLYPFPCAFARRLCLSLPRSFIRPCMIRLPRQKSAEARNMMIKLDEAIQRIPQILTFHNRIDKAVLQLELRALEPFGQLFPDTLFDHARSRKSDQSFRLRKNDIAEHRKAGRHAACRRIGEHRYIQKSRIAVPFDRRSRFFHLHQRQNAFLHPGAARAAKKNDRQTKLCRLFHSPCNFFTVDASHASHQKAGVADAEHDRLALDSGIAYRHALRLSGLLLRFLQFSQITGKFQRIFLFDIRKPFLKCIRIRDHFDPVIRPHPEMIAAFSAYIFICNRFLFGKRRFAGLAHDPVLVRPGRRLWCTLLQFLLGRAVNALPCDGLFRRRQASQRIIFLSAPLYSPHSTLLFYR